ncbi:hypothetical protein QIS74_06383 [Colletotrichum tabaci]|uniref:Uncharacterized protein n=1 Tax=Colletotrichum tabaci TaxID=1209068 RepID=A0AAV9TCS9_9PEZI
MSGNHSSNSVSDDPMAELMEAWWQAEIGSRVVQQAPLGVPNVSTGPPASNPPQPTSQGGSSASGVSSVFQELPNEIKDLVLMAASNPHTPNMRFVLLRQAVIHETDACPRVAPNPGCMCYRKRPNYITFWPLRHRHLVEYPECAVLCNNRNFRRPRDVIAATHRKVRGMVQRERRLDRFPQKLGDWSLTQVVYEDRIPALEVGDPYDCNLDDLVFVHIPTFRGMGPYLYESHFNSHPQVTWDPLLGQLTSIAINILNWEAMGDDDAIQTVYDRMQIGHTWELEAQEGTQNILNGRMPAKWPPLRPPGSVTTGGEPQPVWHPETPQRRVRRPANIPDPMLTNLSDFFQPKWVQNMRILTDVFTSLQELYLVDLTGFNMLDDALREKMHRYLDTPAGDDECFWCHCSHPGKPRTWGGLEDVEFVEVRKCAAMEDLEISVTKFEEFRHYASHLWPRTDINKRPWTRPMPAFN